MAEFKMEYGFLMSHHLELDIFQKHFPAFEFTIQKATWGKHLWETMYGYPLIGVSVWYSPLGGFKEIGSAIAVYPFINFPLFHGEKQSFNFRLGVGLGYLTNHFHPVDNYKNFAIGSHFNIAGSLYFEYRRQITKMLTISAGVGLTHFSNGSIKTPNYGLNYITGTVSISSYLSEPNPHLKEKALPKLQPFEFDGRKKLDFDISLSGGVKNMMQEFGRNFGVIAIYSNLLKRVTFKSKFGGGFDLTYDASDKFLLEWKNDTAKNVFQIIKPGVSFAYQLVFAKISFVFNFGIYLAGKEMSEGMMYQRLTLKYQFMDNFFAHIALNTNFGKADYIGFGIGYQMSFIYKRKIKH